MVNMHKKTLIILRLERMYQNLYEIYLKKILN